MKNWLCSLAVAFSLYSKIPMPRVEWTKERMEYAMCFFPLIGLVVGAAYWLFGTACGALGLGETVFYAGAGTLIPLAVTGGIHMDGYLDTCDALCSYGSREKRLEILKDPHTGAFAVIRCGMYLLGFAAVFSLLPPERLGMAAGIFTLSRALSGFAVVSFPKAKRDGLVATFSENAAKREVQVCSVVWGLLALGIIFRTAGAEVCLACGLAAGAAFWRYRAVAFREFGGITGDLAGYFLQRAELWQLAAAAAVMTAGRWLG